MKKVLVTGSTGFLGRHLVKKLEELGYSIVHSNTTYYNLLFYEHLSNNIEHKFDYIFHLAAKTKAGDWCKFHMGEQWIENQLINTNILKYWYEHQPQAKLICFGTSCSYAPSSYPLHEFDYMAGEPDYDLYTYAMTKRMLLTGCKALNHQYGLNYIHYILPTLYGPGFDDNDSHFIFDLIKKISAGKYKGEDVELWGDGNQRRELLYIDDTIDMILKSLSLNNESVNLGWQVDYTIKEFANKVSYIIGYDDQQIKYNPNKFTGVLKKLLCNKKLNGLINTEFKLTSLETGLQKTINYYLTKHNYDKNNTKELL